MYHFIFYILSIQVYLNMTDQGVPLTEAHFLVQWGGKEDEE